MKIRTISHSVILVALLGGVIITGGVHAAEFIEERSFRYSGDGVENFTIESTKGRLELKQASGLEILVTLRIWTDAKDKERADRRFSGIRVEESVYADSVELGIHTDRSGGGLFGLFGSSSDKVKISVVVEVPAGLEITTETGSGEVSGRGLVNNLKIGTGSGDVRLESIVGNLEIDTGAGSVMVKGLNGRLEADTGAGNVEASGAIVGFSIDTGAGSVELTTTQAVLENSEINTGAGSVELTLASYENARIDLDTGMGSIDTYFEGGEIVEKSRGSLVALFGTGEPRIKLDTGVGSISVR